MLTSRTKAILIDIDDTIIRLRKGARPQSFFEVLHTAGVELSGLAPAEATLRIEETKLKTWWHWSDFIVALKLPPNRFWCYAFERERAYLEPTGMEIGAALHRLRSAGFWLYITSNNPSSGILHKLRLAGLADIHGTTLFHQLLGATELQAMKSDPTYWRKALAHCGFDAEEVVVVGDNPRDDYTVPQSIGIPHTFLIHRNEDRSAQDTDSLTHVMDFHQIADMLLPEQERALPPAVTTSSPLPAAMPSA